MQRRHRRRELEIAGVGRARAVVVGGAGQTDAHAAHGHHRAVLEARQRGAVGIAQVGGVARKRRRAHALEKHRLAEIVFVVAGREDVGRDHVGQRHDAGALVEARHQGGRERVAAMGEDHAAAGGSGARALRLHHGGEPREAAAALAVWHRHVAHQVDVVDQDEGDLRRGGRRLRSGKAHAAHRNEQQAGGDAAGDQHGNSTLWDTARGPEGVCLRLKDNSAANSVCSPPPCGEGLGVGVAVVGRSLRNNHDPPPQPSPTRGEGADRVRRSHVPFNEIRSTMRTTPAAAYLYATNQERKRAPVWAEPFSVDLRPNAAFTPHRACAGKPGGRQCWSRARNRARAPRPARARAQASRRDNPPPAA